MIEGPDVDKDFVKEVAKQEALLGRPLFHKERAEQYRLAQARELIRRVLSEQPS